MHKIINDRYLKINDNKGMGKGILTAMIIFIMLSIITGCNRNIAPGEGSNGQEKTYDEATFDYIYSEGLRQKLTGNPGDAITSFEQCIKINPTSDAAYYQIAQILLGSGDAKNGKKYLKKAISIEPSNIWYNLALADLYLRQNNLDSAIISYEKIIKIYPEKENLEITLANLYAENSRFNEARVILSRFDEKYGANENTTLALVKILIEENKFREAHEKIRDLIAQKPDDIIYNGIEAEIYRKEGETKKASDLYAELIKRNPDDPQIQLSLCDFLISQKDYDEMFSVLRTITLNENISKEQKINLFSGLIDNKEIQNGYGKQLEIALMVLEASYPGDNIIILLRPDLLEKVGDLDKAAGRLEEIIKTDPSNYFAWEKLLLIYYEKKDFKLLESKGQECATKFNMSILAKILYANAAMENKEFSTALEELRKAEILAGDNKDQKLQVLTLRADVYYRMRDFNNSFSTFDQALGVNDTDLTVLNNYAYYLAEQNMRLKDAEKMAKEVKEKSKDNTTFLDTYAWVLYKRGKDRDAARIMEKIINEGKADDAEYYEHYGFILKKMGKCREAVENWEHAVKIDPTKTYLEAEIKNCKK